MEKQITSHAREQKNSRSGCGEAARGCLLRRWVIWTSLLQVSPAVSWCLLVKGKAGETSGTLQGGWRGGVGGAVSCKAQDRHCACVIPLSLRLSGVSQSDHRGRVWHQNQTWASPPRRGEGWTLQSTGSFSVRAPVSPAPRLPVLWRVMIFVRVSPHRWIHVCDEKVDYCLSTEDSAGKHISPFHDIPIYASEEEVSRFQQCLYVYVCISCSIFSAAPVMVRFFTAHHVCRVQSECQRNHRLSFYCFQSLQSISLFFLSSVIFFSFCRHFRVEMLLLC